MLSRMFSALSGLRNTSRRIQNNAKKHANVNTAGFKKNDVNSVDNKSGGTGLNNISRSQIQDSLISTGNALDLTIDGDRFFQVTNPNAGNSFSSLGSFKQDKAGNIVDASGNVLLPVVNVPGNDTGISVDSNGQISSQIEGKPALAGQLQLASFQNPRADGLGTVQFGFLEGSNLDITEKIIDPIVSTWAFNANINVIKANDEMLGSILDIKS
jgi:flagellar basal-body rod protein FlgG